MEAVLEGYSEGIALDPDGRLSEGSGQNLFLVRDGVLYTPSIAASVLAGITRANLLRAAPDLGLAVGEGRYGLAALDVARAVFLANSVLGIVPVAALTAGGRERTWEGEADMLAALAARA